MLTVAPGAPLINLVTGYSSPVIETLAETSVAVICVPVIVCEGSVTSIVPSKPSKLMLLICGATGVRSSILFSLISRTNR